MKKILSLIMVFALIMTAFVGCGEKTGIEEAKELTAQEVFDKVQEESQDITNASFLADFELEMTGLEQLGLAGPMGLVMTGDIKDTQNMMINLEVQAQGMTIAAEIFMKDQKMLIHAPMLQGIMGYAYLSADLDTIAEQTGTPITQPDPEKIKAIMARFEESTEYSIYDLYKLDENKEVVEITVNEEVIETTKLTANIVLDGAEDMIFEFINFIMTDEEAKEVFFASLTEEQLAETQAQLSDETMRAEFTAALEALTINELSVVMYADANYQPVKTEMVIDIVVVDPTTEQTMNIKLTGFMDYFNIGGVEDIILPEVAPEEIMDLNDMY